MKTEILRVKLFIDQASSRLTIQQIKCRYVVIIHPNKSEYLKKKTRIPFHLSVHIDINWKTGAWNSFAAWIYLQVYGSTVSMAEWSKAPDSRCHLLVHHETERSGPRMWAWVRIPLLTAFYFLFVFVIRIDQKSASAGNRTPINCLEGNYASHYTTNAYELKFFNVFPSWSDDNCKSQQNCISRESNPDQLLGRQLC